MITTDEGVLHAPPVHFGKMPEKLMHDHAITDGAKLLYCHMHWRYGNTQRNFEGYASMAKFMDISSAAIARRLQELEAADWIVIVPRAEFGVGRLTNIYHVFVSQKACVQWRAENNCPKPDYSFLIKRVSRAGKGNPNPKRPYPNSGSVTVVNLSSDTVVNPGSYELDSENYPDSSNDLDQVLRGTPDGDPLEAELDSDFEAGQQAQEAIKAKQAAERLASKKSEETPRKSSAKKKTPADVPPPGEGVLDELCLLLYGTLDAWVGNGWRIRNAYNALALAYGENVTLGNLRTFKTWWYNPFKNWMGKNGQRPRAAQIKELWATALTSEKGQVNDANTTKGQLDSKQPGSNYAGVKLARIPGQ